jgi:hypothetical protein
MVRASLTAKADIPTAPRDSYRRPARHLRRPESPDDIIMLLQ